MALSLRPRMARQRRKLTVGYKGGTAQVERPGRNAGVRRSYRPRKTSLARGQKLFIKLADDQKERAVRRDRQGWPDAAE